MADESIVTSYEIDDSDYQAKISAMAASTEGFAENTADADSATKQLSATLGSAAGKANAMAQATAKETAATQQQTKSLADLKKQIDAIQKNKLTLTDPKQVAAANAQLDKLRQQYQKLDTATAKSSKGVGTLFGSIGEGAKSAASSIPGIGGLFSSLGGPIAIAAGAVAGLIANLTRLDGVSKFVDGLSFSFDALGQRLTSLQGIKSLFDPATFAKDYAMGQAYAEILDGIDAKQRDIDSSNADADKQIAGLNQRLRDRTKSDEERLATADQITAIEIDRAEKEEAALKTKLDLIKFEIAARKIQGTEEDQLSDELLNRQNEAEVAITRAQTARIALTESVERRRNGIVEEGASERARIEEKEQANAKAAAEKRLAEQKKIADDRLSVEKELQKAIIEAQTGQQKEESQAGATRDERIAKAHDDTELLKQIEEQYQQSIIEIQTRYGAERVAAQDALDASIAARRRSANEAALDQLIEDQTKVLTAAVLAGDNLDALMIQQAEQRDALVQSIRDKEIEEKLAQFDREYADAEQQGLDLQELTAVQQEELAALKAGYAEKDAEVQEQNAELVAEKLKERSASEVAIIDSAGQQLQELLGGIASGQIATAEEANKALVAITLQSVGAIVKAKIVELIAQSAAFGAKAGPVGAAVGLAGGLAIGAVIDGLLAQLASSITGNYEGDPYVGGTPDLPGSRDRYIRRVHLGERIVTADTNAEHYDALEAMEGGRFGKWMRDNSPLPNIEESMALNFTPGLSAYLDSDEGQRDTVSVTFPHSFDRNIVEQAKQQATELRGTRQDIQYLTEVVERGQRARSRRYRGLN